MKWDENISKKHYHLNTCAFQYFNNVIMSYTFSIDTYTFCGILSKKGIWHIASCMGLAPL